MKIATALRSTMGQSMVSAFAAGTTNSPKLEIYAGSMPSAMGLSITADLLTEHALTNQVATEASGIITFDAIGEELAVNITGSPGWARIIDRDGAEVIYLTVSDTGQGGELQLNTVNLQAGSSVFITGGTIVVGS
ncbi:hypothetical protein [uncultured Marinobacter sp.]|uniref:hypothetical protein n=1 Tax=uncultured Marinobacter sp. TaxID=187379 RepID=UPI0030DB5F18|tara:strand:- start:1105 stop:1509 length:405 start_codon:yes stop_codon:yes gene_type:complete